MFKKRTSFNQSTIFSMFRLKMFLIIDALLFEKSGKKVQCMRLYSVSLKLSSSASEWIFFCEGYKTDFETHEFEISNKEASYTISVQGKS